MLFTIPEMVRRDQFCLSKSLKRMSPRVSIVAFWLYSGVRDYVQDILSSKKNVGKFLLQKCTDEIIF